MPLLKPLCAITLVKVVAEIPVRNQDYETSRMLAQLLVLMRFFKENLNRRLRRQLEPLLVCPAGVFWCIIVYLGGGYHPPKPPSPGGGYHPPDPLTSIILFYW